MDPKYKRLVLKLSGEALSGANGFGIDWETLLPICRSIKQCVDAGTQVGIVVGGGNFWRGRTSGTMDRVKADHMGMMATVINALALQDGFREIGVPARVQTSIPIGVVAEPYERDRTVRHLEKGRVVIFGCGTGSPFFSTDTAAALRAAEVGADIVLKATMVDGVYDKDPRKFPDARRYQSVTFTEVLEKQLNVMDMTAFSICRENKVPVLVFGLDDPKNIRRAVWGEELGTVVKEA